MSLQLLAPPAAEPVTLAEAKAHLKLDTSDEDALVAALITAARARAEWHTGRAFVTQRWRLRLDAWPQQGVIELPLPPLVSVEDLAELELAREAIREASDLVHLMDDIDLYKSEQRRTLELHQAMRQMRATIEKKIASGINIDTLLELMFQAAESPLKAAFDFRVKDYWTICIYVAEENSSDHRRYLKCIAHRRTTACEMAKARRWQEGVGVVGAAYAYRQEVIIPDISAPELGSAFRLAPDISTLDDVRHRSFIAAPIQLDGEREPWGAVIATSDRPGHFSLNAGEGLQPAETLRSLAGMVSLAVRVTELCSSSP
jgi:uncharacterized phiE125 gp8 family phage protein